MIRIQITPKGTNYFIFENLFLWLQKKCLPNFFHWRWRISCDERKLICSSFQMYGWNFSSILNQAIGLANLEKAILFHTSSNYRIQNFSATWIRLSFNDTYHELRFIHERITSFVLITIKLILKAWKFRIEMDLILSDFDCIHRI